MKAIRFLGGKFFSVSFPVFLAATLITTGCGSLPGPPPPAFSGNTNVTVLLSSTANDQLSQFQVSLTSLSLTNKAGNTLNVFQTAQSQTPHNLEFIHVNGGIEPLLTFSIPQGIYTAATASIGSASFTCETIDPSSGNLNISTFAYGQTPSNQVVVNLPAPITITGTAMGLSLNMLVSKSARYPSTCVTTGIAEFSISPTFNLTPLALSQQSTSNVKPTNLRGEISSVSVANKSFTVALAVGAMAFPSVANSKGQTLSVNTNAQTAYQGVGDISALTVGTFVDMDLSIQPDGSELATRIAIADSDTTNLSASTGPLLQIPSSQPTFFAFGRQNQGFLLAAGRAGQMMPYSFGAATFQVSGWLTNLLNLPFSAVFDAGHLFPGQNVYVTSHAVTLSPSPTYFPATTITLIPQIINGTITGIASDGDFSTYTVTLAPYDLIPNLAVQAGQTTALSDPHQVIVYVDSNAQRLNSKPLSLAGVARFNGLIFDDNGIARMDCGQVLDGVAQ